MGTRMAPSYANCFMHVLKTNFLQTQTRKPLLWKRYIDDIIMFWPHSTDSLHTFLRELNAFHPNLKFTWETSQTKIIYLDLEIYKGSSFTETNTLDVTTHFKNTNTFQHLHFSSCHPRSTFKGIIKGEAIRFIRTNTNESNSAGSETSKVWTMGNRKHMYIPVCIYTVQITCYKLPGEGVVVLFYTLSTGHDAFMLGD